jgi:hypothetical protein
MAVTAEQLLDQAKKVLESRGFRVVEASEAADAEAKAAAERAEANAASTSEDEEITAFKQLANDYTKE